MEVLVSFISQLISLIPAMILTIIAVILISARAKKDRLWDWGRALESQTDMSQVPGGQNAWGEEICRAFVEAYGLELVHATLSTNVCVSGEYRGHYLLLEICPSRDVIAARAMLNAFTSEERTEVLKHKLAEPTPPNVLNVLTASGYAFLPGTLVAGDGGKRLSYEESGFERELDSNKLYRISEALSDLAEGYPVVVAAGGAVAPALQTIAREDSLLRNVIAEMLKDIAQATQHLAGRTEQLLCLRCLMRCGPHRADLPWQPDVTYYGCRACHQSQEFIDCPQGVVAVLDTAWQGAQERQGECLRVNWLARRALFDFDRVEIIRATDKDIEHFAMQVGNDTDPYRKSRYGRTRCTIAPICHPSENTLRILESLFGQIDV